MATITKEEKNEEKKDLTTAEEPEKHKPETNDNKEIEKAESKSEQNTDKEDVWGKKKVKKGKSPVNQTKDVDQISDPQHWPSLTEAVAVPTTGTAPQPEKVPAKGRKKEPKGTSWVPFKDIGQPNSRGGSKASFNAGSNPRFSGGRGRGRGRGGYSRGDFPKMDNQAPPFNPYNNQPYTPGAGEFYPATPPPREIVRRQVEYYFSPENLVKDSYLRQRMDHEGYVSVEVIAAFPRLKHFSKEIICEELKDSKIVEVKDQKMRPREKPTMWVWPKGAIANTVQKEDKDNKDNEKEKDLQN